METGKKMLIGALTLLAGASLGEYELYKKFENTPRPLVEVARWPYNTIWAEIDKISEEYPSLTKPNIQQVNGKIHNLEKFEGKGHTTWWSGRYHYFKEDEMYFIQMEDGKKFVYTGDFFAGTNDIVILNFLPTKEMIKINDFSERVKKFRANNLEWLWATRGHDNIMSINTSVEKSLKRVPQTKLSFLDGIIEDYQILEDN